MIFGESFSERDTRLHLKDCRMVGKRKRKFVWFPAALPGGKMVWLEFCWYQCEKIEHVDIFPCFFRYSWKLLGKDLPEGA